MCMDLFSLSHVKGAKAYSIILILIISRQIPIISLTFKQSSKVTFVKAAHRLLQTVKEDR